ncbi:MAG: hypothetical protein OXU36_08060 [Candidatus Poribacteria bacterium]|nr:hypothetical protein [Candidatus Poribacteria bacterium]
METELRYLLFRYEGYLAEQQRPRFDSDQWQRIWEASPSCSIERIFPQPKDSQVLLEADQEGVFAHRLGDLLL